MVLGGVGQAGPVCLFRHFSDRLVSAIGQLLSAQLVLEVAELLRLHLHPAQLRHPLPLLLNQRHLLQLLAAAIRHHRLALHTHINECTHEHAQTEDTDTTLQICAILILVQFVDIHDLTPKYSSSLLITNYKCNHRLLH